MVTNLKKTIVAVMLLLCGMLSGCVREHSAKKEQDFKSEEESVTEELSAEGNLIDDTSAEEKGMDDTDAQEEEVKENYREALAAGGLICPGFPDVQYLTQMDEQELLDKICPAVVRLENGKLFGSGIIWKMEEDAIWILTNKHLLTEENPDAGILKTDVQPEVVFWDGIRGITEIVAFSEIYDLAVLRMDLETLGYYTAERYYAVRYDEAFFESLKPGDDIFMLGSADYPAGNLFYGTIGNCSVYMEDFDTEMMWAYCEVKPGMSGSGVFDVRGNLIGIVCAGNDQKEAAVLPVDKILEEWEREGY